MVLANSSQSDASMTSRYDDCQQAMVDLQSSASFVPIGLIDPFVISLSLDSGRLLLDVRDANDSTLHLFVFSMSPFRRLIKDYQLLVESHEQAIKDGGQWQIQAIDMGRRSIHDEGAALMIVRLTGKINISFETACRLFTLIFVLHRRI